MKNAKTKFLITVLSFALCFMLILSLFSGYYIMAGAQTAEQTLYCDDGNYYGSGQETTVTYDISCDDFGVTGAYNCVSPPSFGNSNSSMSNTCGPLTGMNIVTFYDRWYTNLVPNYTPGVLSAKGYQYLPNLGYAATDNCISSLYSLMKTGELGGTTSSNFKSGLKAFVENAGYSLSMSSFYSGTKTVNLNTLKTAIESDKVGMVMLSPFNYISDIIYNADRTLVRFYKKNIDAGHMAMVTGYEVYDFYNNGVKFLTKTFLNVSSGFASGDSGYIELNDNYLNIQEAWIVTIS